MAEQKRVTNLKYVISDFPPKPKRDIKYALVRYHYLIRDIKKHRIKDTKRYQEKKAIWESLPHQTQEDLKRFLKYDDLGKR